MINYKINADDELWNGFISKSNEFITIGHNPSICRVLNRSFGYDANYQVILEEEKIIGVFPSMKDKEKLISIPHFSYGDILLENKKELLSTIKSELYGDSYFIRSFQKYGDFFESNKVISFINLHNSEDEQWKHWKSKLRSQIKKGLKNNFVIKNGSSISLLEDFYSVYTVNMKDLGSPVLPKIFFENLLKFYEYGGLNIVCVYKDSKVVGAGFVIEYQGFSEVCWASTIRYYNKFNVNMVLYWEMIKTQISEKSTIFSFGRSTINFGTYKFKQQWGVQNIPIFLNKSHSGSNIFRKLDFLKKVWTLLPLKISIILSGLISKKIY